MEENKNFYYSYKFLNTIVPVFGFKRTILFLNPNNERDLNKDEILFYEKYFINDIDLWSKLGLNFANSLLMHLNLLSLSGSSFALVNKLKKVLSIVIFYITYPLVFSIVSDQSIKMIKRKKEYFKCSDENLYQDETNNNQAVHLFSIIMSSLVSTKLKYKLVLPIIG